jgi:hypothetical protein
MAASFASRIMCLDLLYLTLQGRFAINVACFTESQRPRGSTLGPYVASCPLSCCAAPYLEAQSECQSCQDIYRTKRYIERNLIGHKLFLSARPQPQGQFSLSLHKSMISHVLFMSSSLCLNPPSASEFLMLSWLSSWSFLLEAVSIMTLPRDIRQSAESHSSSHSAQETTLTNSAPSLHAADKTIGTQDTNENPGVNSTLRYHGDAGHPPARHPRQEPRRHMEIEGAHLISYSPPVVMYLTQGSA